MKGYRFYLEYPDMKEKNKATRKNLGNNHQGNVIAILDDTGRLDGIGEWIFDGIGAVFFEANSPVASTSVGWQYLLERCKRISEKQAREIHPELFKYLDN